jgi:RNA polymerase sigma-70 factor (ECF subfamily)
MQFFDDVDDEFTQLMRGIRRDNAEAFQTFVVQRMPILAERFQQIGLDIDRAEDLMQEVFLRVYRLRKTFTPYDRFTPWFNDTLEPFLRKLP